MPNKDRTKRRGRAHGAYARSMRKVLLAPLLALAQLLAVGIALAHEGHDHDKPAPLNVPIAPRVVAVTPDYELVGVLSGAQRLTVFLHHFATGEPVTDAKIIVSGGDQEVEAVPKEPGVFDVMVPWLRTADGIDLTFRLMLPNDEDILTGRLEAASNSVASAGQPSSSPATRTQFLLTGLGALAAGILLTLLVGASMRRRRGVPARDLSGSPTGSSLQAEDAKVKQLRRAPVATAAILLAVSLLLHDTAHAQATVDLPSVPPTMATDVPQRMADGNLFVPKATQHLLSVRTRLAEVSRAPRTVQLVGTVIADPNSFGRVQTGHAGRIEPANGGLAYVGKRVEKNDLLGYLRHHIEAYNKGNLQGEIAELEGRIALQEAKLARYLKAPLAVPPIKIDEAKGEIEALRQKRKELLPTLAEREEIRAPIGGVVSVANVVAGQVVDAREVLFEIVDPSRFWVEAIAHDASVVSDLSAAFAVTNTGEKLPLQFAGLGLSLKQQAAPLSFRVGQSSPNLSIGKPVTVILQSSVELSGIVLPAGSVVRAQSGLPIVWVKTEPERFEPHPVRYEALDGQRVVIITGLKPDVRVVTEGATLLNQIR
jgi:cobalt-zinc-cadmium efflux system membrane fusion protein